MFGRRSWKLAPYNLAIINACLKKEYDSRILDANLEELNEQQLVEKLNEERPDLIGITSFSTEYIKEIVHTSNLLKKQFPDIILVLGGILPTIMEERIVDDINADFFVLGEGEYRLIQLIRKLNNNDTNFSDIDGIAYKRNNKTTIYRQKEYIQVLDDIPFPDYAPYNVKEYGNILLKFSTQLIPRQFPFAYTVTSRGCPYKCIFCSASSVSGNKVRYRSANNVLAEIDELYLKDEIREIIFLDDHFLANKKRVIAILNGILERQYDLLWKCANVADFTLNAELLELMRKSGSYQITISPESGNEDVLKSIIKKPTNLIKTKEMIKIAKSLGFEIIANFVIGFPGETWNQIRDTFRYAEEIDVEMVNFHLATPLPKTELMQICIEQGFVKPTDYVSGYTKSVISTDEFTSQEIQILRAYEWDRINFSTREREMTIAEMEGITLEEVIEWRRKTRRLLGTTNFWLAEKQR